MTIDRFTNREDLKLALVVDKMDIFNYALYENGVAPIRGLHIINDTGDPIDELFIRTTSDSRFFEKLVRVSKHPNLRLHGLSSSLHASTAYSAVHMESRNAAVHRPVSGSSIATAAMTISAAPAMMK